jgi:hypothetical protein
MPIYLPWAQGVVFIAFQDEVSISVLFTDHVVDHPERSSRVSFIRRFFGEDFPVAMRGWKSRGQRGNCFVRRRDELSARASTASGSRIRRIGRRWRTFATFVRLQIIRTVRAKHSDNMHSDCAMHTYTSIHAILMKIKKASGVPRFASVHQQSNEFIFSKLVHPSI